MGLFTLTLTGCGFLLIGALEALTSSTSHPIPNPSPSPPPPLSQIKSTTVAQSPESNLRTNPSSSTLSFIAIFVFSFFFIVNSLASLFDALNSTDRVGTALQLQALAVASLFLLYSILGLLRDLTNSFPLPSSLLNLIILFAFVEEFLLFYLQRKDPSGIENRYFDLLLLPITICVFSTILTFRSPSSNLPKLSRGVGLILQGTWFLQMGFSFYSNFIVHGCHLNEKSRGNYTIRCKGHPDYHRGRAIATLQFNCHLALLVVSVVSFYAIVMGKNGDRSDFRMYRPIGVERQSLDGQAQFTLDSDGDDDEIKEEGNMVKPNGAVVEMTVNGYGSHQ